MDVRLCRVILSVCLLTARSYGDNITPSDRTQGEIIRGNSSVSSKDPEQLQDGFGSWILQDPTDHGESDASDFEQVYEAPEYPDQLASPVNVSGLNEWPLRSVHHSEFVLTNMSVSGLDHFDEERIRSDANRSMEFFPGQLPPGTDLTSALNRTFVCSAVASNTSMHITQLCRNMTSTNDIIDDASKTGNPADQEDGQVGTHKERDEQGSTNSCGNHSWVLYVKIVLVPFFTLVGLVGNTLSFVVMFSPLYARKSYSYYLRALAVTDNLTLIITLVLTINEVNYEWTGARLLSHHTQFTCKLSEFLRYVIYLLSSWLIVCFSVDRYIAVCHPLQRARLCTERGALIAMVSVLGGALLTQINVLVYMEKLDRDNPLVCHVPLARRLQYYGWRYFWSSFLLRFFLPFSAIVLCNGLIIFHIKRMRIRREHAHTRERVKKRSASLAVYTLFAVCAAFVVTMLPNAVLSTIQYVNFQMLIDKDLYCTVRMLNTPVSMFRLINYSLNFVLYGLTGRQFRRETRRLLLCQLRFRERVRDIVLHKVYGYGMRGDHQGARFNDANKPLNAQARDTVHVKSALDVQKRRQVALDNRGRCMGTRSADR